MEIINKKYFPGIALLAVFVIFLLYISHSIKPKDIKYVNIAGQKVEVELAITPEAQEQGLSGRTGLSDNQGMLFVFARPDRYNFWMKDMNFPIDMIWFSQDLRVVYIKKDATPESYPETFGPEENAMYVLEVGAGFSDKNGLKAGDQAKFTY